MRKLREVHLFVSLHAGAHEEGRGLVEERCEEPKDPNNG